MLLRARQLLAVAAATAAAMALAGPAHADTRTFRDGDGMRHGVDLTSVKVVHEKNVRVVIRHQNLRPSPRSGAIGVVYIDARRGDDGRPEYAMLAGLFDGTDYALVRTDGWSFRDGERVECRYRMRLDYGEDITRMRFARGCFDRPDEVRVAVRVSGQQRDRDVVHDWLHGRRDLTPWVGR